MVDKMFLVALPDKGHIIIGTDDERGQRDYATLVSWGLQPQPYKGEDVNYDDLPYPYYLNIEFFALELGVVLDRTGRAA